MRNMPPELASNDSLSYALAAALQALPKVVAEVARLQPLKQGLRLDALIEARFGDQRIDLWIEEKSDVFPRDAREQIMRWRRVEPAELGKTPHYFVVAADAISPGARELLIADGIGYFERSGRLHLPFPGAYILVDIGTASKRSSPQEFEIFTVARKTVLHAMLLEAERPHSVQDLAQRSGSSPATVSRLMSFLQRHEWIVATGSGPSKTRKLSKPGAVLDAWVRAEQSAVADRPVRRFFVAGEKAPQLPGRILDTVEMEYLATVPAYNFTAEAAAEHYAPFLTGWSVATMRAPRHITDRLLSTPSLGVKEVREGFNLLVIDDASGAQFTQFRHSIPLASPVQTYVDLMCMSGRAPDAAKHLRETVLGF